MQALHTIGFIGLGHMGKAVALNIAKTFKQAHFLFNDTDTSKTLDLSQVIGGQVTTLDLMVQEADCIFIAVKPHQFQHLAHTLDPFIQKRSSPILIISMLAGIQLEKLESCLPLPARLIRMMPNTPIEVGQGVTTFSLGSSALAEDAYLFQQLFAKSGLVLELPENQLDAATAIAGCGPAFVYQFIEALSDAGVKHGLSRSTATALASQMVAGAGLMVALTHTHPAQLKDQVCSPGGSTIAGVASLEKAAFRGAVIDAVDAAFQRTQALG